MLDPEATAPLRLARQYVAGVAAAADVAVVLDVQDGEQGELRGKVTRIATLLAQGRVTDERRGHGLGNRLFPVRPIPVAKDDERVPFDRRQQGQECGMVRTGPCKGSRC